MKHKLRALLLALIFTLNVMTQVVSAATYYVNTPEEEMMAFSRALTTNESEFTLEYNPEGEGFLYEDLYDFRYSLQDYTDLDYAFYNIKRSSLSISSVNARIVSIDHTLEEWDTPEQTEYVFNTVHKLIRENPSMIKASNYEKAAWAFDYIVDNVTYDYTLTDHSAYGALKNGTAVCQGIANLYYVMAIELGLKCKIVSGGDHAWNLVELEGKWYYVDPTWGACGWGRKYLLRAKKNMTEHTLDTAYENSFIFADSDYQDTGNSGYNGILASVYNVKFDPLKKMNLSVGETFNWMLDNPEGIKLTFTSEDAKVASVSSDGIITGVGTGTTIIHAKSEELGIDQTCEIAVNKSDIKVVGYQDVKVTYNKTANIILKISPSNGKLYNVSYRSLDKTIATVDKNGKVTGVRVGSTKIEVTYGENKKINVPVTVKPAVNSKYKSVSVAVKKTVSIKKAVTVSKNGYKDLIFKSSNTKIAKVSKTGTVTGIKKGSCSIRIYDKATNKLVATVKLTVK